MPLLATTITKGELLTSYVASNLGGLFPGYQLVERDKLLSGNKSVDFVLKDRKGHTLFVECKASRIKERQVGHLFDYYSAILNLEPQPKDMTFVIVGASIDAKLKRQFDGLNVSFKSYRDLGIPFQKLLEDERRRRSRLTPVMATLVTKWQKDKTRIVDVDSVCAQLRCTRNYARTLLHRLESKKWLERISKGVYAFIPAEFGYEERFPPVDPFTAGSRLIEPYYFSYGTATSYYGFTTQIPSTHFIATTKKKPPYLWRNIGFHFVTLSRRKFFGFKEVILNRVKVRIAEPEKAILDSLDKPRYAGGIEEIVRVIYRGFGKIDSGKLAEYAVKMSSHTLCQRLGFILDFLRSRKLIEFSSHPRRVLLSKVGKSSVYLSPRGPKEGGLHKEWRIVKNLSDSEILAEIDIA